MAQPLDGSSGDFSAENIINPEQLLSNPADNGTLEDDPKFGLMKPGEVDPLPLQPAKEMYPDNILSFGDAEFFGRNHFVIDKNTRTMTIWTEDDKAMKLHATYPVDLGRVSGNKKALGDKKTPEGIYFIQTKLKGRELDYNEYGSIAFPVDYPNFFDNRESKTGYGIWLHATPDTKSLRRGSRGCVVVRDSVIKELDTLIEPGKTPFVVDDNVKLVKKDKWEQQSKRALQWLESWRSAWMEKRLDDYMNNYADDFSAMKLSKAGWRKYKDGLSQKYKFIEVNLSQPKILRSGDYLVFKFLQQYRSDSLQDFGQKTLYVKERSGKFEIVGEVWQPADHKFIALAHTNSDRTVSNAQ
jgi:murein L,D-transpeptidase YafK